MLSLKKNDFVNLGYVFRPFSIKIYVSKSLLLDAKNNQKKITHKNINNCIDKSENCIFTAKIDKIC